MATARVRMEVHGAEKFAGLAKRLKDAGRKDLRRELFRALNSATKGIRADIKARTPEFLPDAYAAVFTPDLKLSTTQRSTGPGIGVRIRARSRRQIRDLERGFLRAPLFGMRKHWFNHRLSAMSANKAHFFTEPARGGSDEARRKLLEAMDRIADQIEG